MELTNKQHPKSPVDSENDTIDKLNALIKLFGLGHLVYYSGYYIHNYKFAFRDADFNLRLFATIEDLDRAVHNAINTRNG